MNDKSNQNDTLGLGPFRQQAALIARNKETAAEQLDQITKELNDVENQLKDKQQKLQETVGEIVLRGEDLKQFVNTLRAKSNVYKQQRAELASVKAEANDLMETLENLRAQDPSLTTNEEDPSSLEPMVSRPDSPVESRGITELSRLVDGLTRAVLAAREKLAPMSQQLRPLRERLAELKDECDSKKQVSKHTNIYLHLILFVLPWTFVLCCTLLSVQFCTLTKNVQFMTAKYLLLYPQMQFIQLLFYESTHKKLCRPQKCERRRKLLVMGEK
jgi:DNA repair exonuclease SbcCD ATPase subunit